MKTFHFLAGLALAFLATFASAAPTIQAFGVRTNAGASVYPGNVLYVDCATANPDAFARAYLIDQTGKVIKSWGAGQGSVQWLAKPIGTDGSIAVFHKGGAAAGNKLGSCGAPSGNFTLSKLSADNKLTVIYRDPTCGLSHDFEVLQDGTFLILCQKLITDPAVSTQPFEDNIIRHIDASGNVLWSWSTDEHYAQLGLTDEGRQMIMAGNTYAEADVFHTNNISLIPPNASAASNPAFAAGNIMVDQRNTNIIFIIDYQNGAGTGDIVWQVGNISVGQHTARVIGTGLPGDGHILMLNNGGHAGYPPQNVFGSSVQEYDPIAGQIVWSWAPSVIPDGTGNPIEQYAFQTYYRGSTQRLPNGNTFIDESVWGRFIEVDPAGNIVWEYVHEFGNPKPNKYAPDRRIYRAYKVEACWPGCFAQANTVDGAWTW